MSEWRISRRAACCLVAGGAIGFAMSATRKMRINLSPGAIGLKSNQRQAIAYAAQFGFEAVDPAADELGALSDGELQTLLGEMKQKGVVWAAGGLPPNLHDSPEVWAEGMRRVPAIAKALQRAGVTRATKWISPGSPSLTY